MNRPVTFVLLGASAFTFLSATPSIAQLGACCFDDCSCLVTMEEECDDAGGHWPGQELCEPNPCECPPGACCLPDGLCAVMNLVECSHAGGEFLWQACDPNPCPQPGACCLYDCSCLLTAESECITMDGTYLGDGTSCLPNPCDCPVGACCFPDGTCLETLETDCAELVGVWAGWEIYCEPDPCLPTSVPDPVVDRVTWGKIKSCYTR